MAKKKKTRMMVRRAFLEGGEGRGVVGGGGIFGGCGLSCEVFLSCCCCCCYGGVVVVAAEVGGVAGFIADPIAPTFYLIDTSRGGF